MHHAAVVLALLYAAPVSAQFTVGAGLGATQDTLHLTFIAGVVHRFSFVEVAGTAEVGMGGVRGDPAYRREGDICREVRTGRFAKAERCAAPVHGGASADVGLRAGRIGFGVGAAAYSIYKTRAIYGYLRANLYEGLGLRLVAGKNYARGTVTYTFGPAR